MDNIIKGGEIITKEEVIEEKPKSWNPGETAYPYGMLNSEKVVGEAEDGRRKFRH